MILQLNPALPLETPKGPGLAHFLIDYSPEADLLWVVFDETDGQIWCWPNPQVRAPKNISMNRANPEKLKPRQPPVDPRTESRDI